MCICYKMIVSKLDYQIFSSGDFSSENQDRKLPICDENLKAVLENDPKPQLKVMQILMHQLEVFESLINGFHLKWMRNKISEIWRFALFNDMEQIQFLHLSIFFDEKLILHNNQIVAKWLNMNEKLEHQLKMKGNSERLQRAFGGIDVSYIIVSFIMMQQFIYRNICRSL